MKKQRAFTLVELLVLLVVAVVIIVLGIPAFNSMITGNRTASLVNEMSTAVTLARSEASTRATTVSICPSNEDYTGCDVGNPRDWSNGYLVFTDGEGATPGTFEAATETLLRVWQKTSDNATYTGAPNFLRFVPSGDLDDCAACVPAPVVFSIRMEQCLGRQERQLTITTTGRLGIARIECP